MGVVLSIFKGADRNGNGSLDLAELSLMLRRIVPGVSHEHVQEIMKRFDEDRSSEIDLPEFSRWLYSGAPDAVRNALNHSMRNEQEAVRAAFCVVDKDGSGTMSKIELSSILGKTCPDVSAKSLDVFFASIDLDGN